MTFMSSEIPNQNPSSDFASLCLVKATIAESNDLFQISIRLKLYSKTCLKGQLKNRQMVA